MQDTRRPLTLTRAVAVAMAMIGWHQAQAGGLTTLYTFTGGSDGGNPFAGLLAGPGGSFFGTTTRQGGSVFQLVPPASGQTAWTLTTLYTFSGGVDGAFPQTLVQDKDGALYGMTDEGGRFNGVAPITATTSAAARCSSCRRHPPATRNGH